MKLLRSTPLLAALAVAGCGKITEADKQAALACVRANIAAMEKGDVNAVMATIHPDSRAYLQTPEFIQSIVGTYKLDYTLESAEIERVTSEGIRVHFVQVTRRLAGPANFPDNRLDGIHLLRRDGDTWKIWHTVPLQARTLDGQPLPAGGMAPAPADPVAPPPPKVATPAPIAPKSAPGPSSAASPAPKLVPFKATTPAPVAATPLPAIPRAVPANPVPTTDGIPAPRAVPVNPSSR